MQSTRTQTAPVTIDLTGDTIDLTGDTIDLTGDEDIEMQSDHIPHSLES